MFTSIKDKIGKLFIIINLISSIIFVFLLFIIYRFYFNYFYENMKNSFLIFHNYIGNNLVINENSEIDYKSLQRDMCFFMPKCCNRFMEIKNEEVLQFYRCDICKSEIAVIEKGIGDFMPKCCNQLMKIIVE